MFENERIGKVDTSREQYMGKRLEGVQNATYWNESNGNRSGHIVEKC